jgi:hypothetical protein
MKKTYNNKAMLLMFSTLCVAVIPAAAQSHPARRPQIDVATTFAADRTNPVSGSNQWLKGGSIELGATAWHDLGIATKVTGLTTDSLGSQGVPLSLLLTTFGPRYRFTHAKLSVYGEGLFGEANGFKSIFPGQSGTIDSASAFALQVGGGFDYTLTRHISYRAVEAFWTRTQFPNGTTNVQNHLQLGTGAVFRF